MVAAIERLIEDATTGPDIWYSPFTVLDEIGEAPPTHLDRLRDISTRLCVLTKTIGEAVRERSAELGQLSAEDVIDDISTRLIEATTLIATFRPQVIEGSREFRQNERAERLGEIKDIMDMATGLADDTREMIAEVQRD